MLFFSTFRNVWWLFIRSFVELYTFFNYFSNSTFQIIFSHFVHTLKSRSKVSFLIFLEFYCLFCFVITGCWFALSTSGPAWLHYTCKAWFLSGFPKLFEPWSSLVARGIFYKLNDVRLYYFYIFNVGEIYSQLLFVSALSVYSCRNICSIF